LFDSCHGFSIEQALLIASSRFVTGNRRGKCHTQKFTFKSLTFGNSAVVLDGIFGAWMAAGVNSVNGCRKALNSWRKAVAHDCA
jgi:hypothetical protein